jgi:hypothetical protein
MLEHGISKNLSRILLGGGVVINWCDFVASSHFCSLFVMYTMEFQMFIDVDYL